ncbi:MAG TPA: hypothetical protein PKW21_10115 [Rhabdaerophilum sp.]|nr:hypothetical protein [Rhabdaerophilum sp.]
MSERIDDLLARIDQLERDLETELAQRAAGLRFRLEQGRAVFEEEVRRRHKELRTHVLRYIVGARPLVILSAPVIYSLIVPFALLDLFVTVYQAICFPIYRIEKVDRSKYLVFDRHMLAYLNAVEKFNCLYCSYCNGIVAYVREVAGRTERHWCPIKHARRVMGAHPYYARFAEYGDGDAWPPPRAQQHGGADEH